MTDSIEIRVGDSDRIQITVARPGDTVFFQFPQGMVDDDNKTALMEFAATRNVAVIVIETPSVT